MRIALGLALCVFYMSMTPVESYANVIPDLVESCGPAVVAITTEKDGEPLSSGSGFNVDSSGIVVTNLHVIRGATAIFVKFPGGDRFQTVRLLGMDSEKDIAILKISGFDLPTVRLGNSNQITVGEVVVAIGNPQGFENTVSSGIVSGRRQTVNLTLLQVTAPISPGSSGGPIFNERKEVVGITTLTWIEDGSQNINFCIPINYVQGMLLNSQSIPLSSIPGREGVRNASGQPGGSLPAPSSGRRAEMESEFRGFIDSIPDSTLFVQFTEFGIAPPEDALSSWRDSRLRYKIRTHGLSEIQINRLQMLYYELYGERGDAWLQIAKMANGFFMEIRLNVEIQFQDSADAILYDPATLREIHRIHVSTVGFTQDGVARSLVRSIAIELSKWAKRNRPEILTE